MSTKNLSNSKDEIMKVEKNICFDMFLKAYGTQPNFKEIEH